MFCGGLLVGVPTLLTTVSWKAGYLGFAVGVLLVLCGILIAIIHKEKHG